MRSRVARLPTSRRCESARRRVDRDRRNVGRAVGDSSTLVPARVAEARPRVGQQTDPALGCRPIKCRERYRGTWASMMKDHEGPLGIPLDQRLERPAVT